jgi:hypothetical protein
MMRALKLADEGACLDWSRAVGRAETVSFVLERMAVAGL